MAFDPQRAIAIARGYADQGYHEGPNNRNDFSGWQYGGSYNPWCDSFVCYCAWQAGYRFPSYSACGDKGDYNVGAHHAHAARNGTWRDPSYRAQTGDLVILSFDVPDQHIEIVEADRGSSLATIGGNTGDMVARRQRRRSNVVGFDALTQAGQLARPPVPITPPKVADMFNPPLQITDWCLFTHPTLGPSIAAVDSSGHVFCEPPDAYVGGPYDDRTGRAKAYWGTRHAARIEPPNASEKAARKKYTIVASTGERYAFPDH